MSNGMGNPNLDGRATVIRVDPVTFAKRLKDARSAAKLTQQQLADACGISDRTVSAWETGTAQGVLADHLFCVADRLGVDARWLATGEAKAPAVTSALAEIVRGLEHLPVEQQEAVRSLVRSLNR